MHREHAGGEGPREHEQQRQPLRTGEIVEQRREVARPLRAAEPATGERVLRRSEHRQIAACPPRPLQQERRQVVRRKPLDQHFIVVPRAPAARVHRDRRVEVLGDGVGEHAPDVEERGAPDQRRRATPEHRVVAILARRDDVVEQRLLVALGAGVLHRVAVREVVRRLYERERRVVEEADRRVEDLGQRHVVRVEKEDEFALRNTERVVDVPRLRVRVVGARDVARPGPRRERPQFRAATVVEHPRDVRDSDRGAARERRLDHLDRLVVRAHEHVDGGQARRQRRSRGRRHPPRQERVQAEAHPSEDLRREQEEEQREVDAAPTPPDTPHEVRAAPAERHDREHLHEPRVSPPEAAPRGRQRRRARHRAPLGHRHALRVGARQGGF